VALGLLLVRHQRDYFIFQIKRGDLIASFYNTFEERLGEFAAFVSASPPPIQQCLRAQGCRLRPMSIQCLGAQPCNRSGAYVARSSFAIPRFSEATTAAV
jgi:hypothetical protein